MHVSVEYLVFVKLFSGCKDFAERITHQPEHTLCADVVSIEATISDYVTYLALLEIVKQGRQSSSRCADALTEGG